jgi:hypothetical protein
MYREGLSTALVSRFLRTLGKRWRVNVVATLGE